MAFRPLLSRPSGRALLGGIGVFVAGWLLVTYAGNIELRGMLLLYLGIAAYLASGFATGFLARRSPIMHGFLLSLLITVAFVLIAALLMAPSGRSLAGSLIEASHAVLGFPLTLLSCILGAIVGDLIAAFTAKP